MPFWSYAIIKAAALEAQIESYTVDSDIIKMIHGVDRKNYF